MTRRAENEQESTTASAVAEDVPLVAVAAQNPDWISVSKVSG